jgi:hypothetical protein
MDLLQLFVEASGLQNNLQKSNVLPIRCDEEEIQILQQHLPCEIADFPCKYLGLPLSLRKLSRDNTQPIIESIVDQLLGACSVCVDLKIGISCYGSRFSTMGSQGSQ